MKHLKTRYCYVKVDLFKSVSFETFTAIILEQ